MSTNTIVKKLSKLQKNKPAKQKGTGCSSQKGFEFSCRFYYSSGNWKNERVQNKPSIFYRLFRKLKVALKLLGKLVLRRVKGL